jgi:hypothetical protein
MNLEGTYNHFFGLHEKTVPHFKHDNLEENLPFLLYHPFGLVHDLPRPPELTLHFKEFGVL